MKMAELSARTGVAAPTIRYYIREGLVPQGKLTSPNQAVYDESHVRALRLTRALVGVGGLAVEQARKVLAHLAEKEGNTYAILGSTQYALTPPSVPRDDDASFRAAERVDALIAAHGWSVRPDNPARTTLAEALVSLEALGVTAVTDMLDTYAAAAEGLARDEIERLFETTADESRVVGVIAFDILGDRLLSALRRLAQEDATVKRLNADAGDA
ncbi:MerR family transcriptional regulator [Myceligenerans pegani]|uniref:MerR family transcriptional regulator n=1 Tax=Myceligenerans pegani TaxID=2776917 RepID=A0ABR9MVQ2_9MICO|nr:MerR family transcriptional regulator [Myceligenerans sp. TRM 65318]MBE1875464.1 MerR family transcriptional regulator [Myceligenerans sp. TRM 65318]MBE3017735.1 MerR family transcriptional regulator [Myceligenerans sp. TRM 65318]